MAATAQPQIGDLAQVGGVVRMIVAYRRAVDLQRVLVQFFGPRIVPQVGVTTAEVVDTMKISGRHVSMDAPFVQGEENSLLDVLENDSEETPDSGLMNDSLRKEVQRALSTLTQREADVITLYFGLNGEHAMTLEEIGEKFNLTRERVRQIKEKAIRRLRHTSRSKALKPYLG